MGWSPAARKAAAEARKRRHTEGAAAIRPVSHSVKAVRTPLLSSSFTTPQARRHAAHIVALHQKRDSMPGITVGHGLALEKQAKKHQIALTGGKDRASFDGRTALQRQRANPATHQAAVAHISSLDPNSRSVAIELARAQHIKSPSQKTFDTLGGFMAGHAAATKREKRAGKAAGRVRKN